MPVGVGLAIGGIGAGLGIWGASKNKDQAAGPQAPTSNFIASAASNTPPSATAASSTATQQAQIAAAQQRKKTAAGDTLLTPQAPAGGYSSGTPKATSPAMLIGR